MLLFVYYVKVYFMVKDVLPMVVAKRDSETPNFPFVFVIPIHGAIRAIIGFFCEKAVG